MNYNEYVSILKRKIKLTNKEILFVCIGTNKVLWDSIGPLVGNYLKEKIGTEKVLGDMKKNICSRWDLIYNYKKIKNKYIIAIDTAISEKSVADQIYISSTPIIMGLAMNKNKGKIGDLSIKIAISNPNLINVEYVKKVSKFVSRGICEILELN